MAVRDASRPAAPDPRHSRESGNPAPFARYPKYKYSGVAWLGDVPSHWEITSLKRRYEVIGGSTPTSGTVEFWDGEIVWITPADLSRLSSFEIETSQRTITEAGLSSCATTLVPAGTIVLSTRAPIGSVGIAAVSLCTNQGCKGLVPSVGQNTRFATYALGSATPDLNIRGKGTTFLELSGDELGAFVFPFPPSTEQERIAAFLDRETAKIDALIAEQEKLIALLKEKRQALISHAVTKGLDPNAPLKDSGIEWLGQVPAHWDIARLGTIFREVSDVGADDLPILSVSIHDGVSDKELDEAEMDRKVTRSEDRSKYKAVQPGDLAYNMMRAWQGGFGAVTVAGQVSPAYVVARPVGEVCTSFIEQLLRTPQAVEQMRRHSRGVTDFRLRLYWEEFKNIRVALPTLPEQQAILDAIAIETTKSDSLVSEAVGAIELLKERRAALISAAVTGKIDVRDRATSNERDASRAGAGLIGFDA